MSSYIGGFVLSMVVLSFMIILFRDLEQGKKLAVHACCALYLIAAAICFK